MKLSKSLLQTIAVAVAMTAASSCADDSLLVIPDLETTIEAPSPDAGVININHPESKEVIPPYEDCPACGMG